MTRAVLAIVCGFVVCVASPVQADWPTYKNSPARVGATPQKLARQLSLRWVYSTPTAPELAWSGPREEPIEGRLMRHRVDYDRALDVVSAGGRLFFGSSVDHNLYCVNATTGKFLWTFYTDGPFAWLPRWPMVKSILVPMTVTPIAWPPVTARSSGKCVPLPATNGCWPGVG